MPDASPLQTHEAWLRAKQDPDDERPTLMLATDAKSGRARVYEKNQQERWIEIEEDWLITVGPFDGRHR